MGSGHRLRHKEAGSALSYPGISERKLSMNVKDYAFAVQGAGFEPTQY